jgi:Ca-activated chloride channel family protein
MKLRILLLFGFCLALFVPAPAQADGIIIPLPPICEHCPPPPCPGPFPCPPPKPMSQLVIRYHHVTVKIQDQVATTHVDQVFYNPNDWAVEGTYSFPLPTEASVSSFLLWVDGEPVEGQILDAEQARKQYEEIVRSLRDPALLEYAGLGAVQAHIFPIPPQDERRVELEYSQVLKSENGLVRYVYPLSTEKFSAWPLEQVSISVDVRDRIPIQAIYSPSHKINISRESENHVRAGYEEDQVLPDADFALFYSLGEQTALHLLSYRSPADENDPDGFFLLMLAPSPKVSGDPLPKDIILVLDRSGSMEGEKFRQAQDALSYILNHLNEADRFNILVFSTGLDRYTSDLRPAREASQAIDWVERLSAQGSTDINRALLEAAALARGERPAYVIFLTDGLPTEGEVDSQKILDNLADAAPSNLRLFAFGVGYDVDTFLLDSLAQAHHGASSYVLPGERLDEAVSGFYEKINTPVLTNLDLDFGDLRVYDLYPSPLPDLFSGSQIIILGRYRQSGETTIRLSGQIESNTQSFDFPGQVFSNQSKDQYPENTLPRLWATRKIGYLLNKIRLNGPDQETIGQIVSLSIRYGIVTPYTSYLVSETAPLSASEQERIAGEQLNKMQAMPAAPAYGQAAVERAIDEGSLAEADAPAALEESGSKQIRVMGGKTFVLQGDRWLDTAFDPDSMSTVEVQFLSDEYFDLAASNPELASAFAVGQSVIVVFDGRAYEVVQAEPSDQPTSILPLIPTPSPGEESLSSLKTPEATPYNSKPTIQITPTNVSASPIPLSPQAEATSTLLYGGILVLVILIGAGIILVRNIRR